MSSLLSSIFAFLLIIVWIVSGVYITAASTKLFSHRNDHPQLNTAYWFCFWAAFVTWGLIALFILLVILAIVGLVALFGSGAGEAMAAAQQYGGTISADTLSVGLSWFTLAFLIFALILVIVTGILSIGASTNIAGSKSDNDDVQQAYKDCIIAASISMGAAGILIVGTIVYVIISIRNKRIFDKTIAQLRLVRAKQYLRDHPLDTTTPNITMETKN